jgi:hypothetical protein
LEQFLGSSGVPLSYVVRDKEQPAAEDVYRNVYEEMIARAPLKGFYFDRDNETVWHFLWNILGPFVVEGHVVVARSGKVEPWYKYCQEFESTQDGRAAYMKLKRNGWV